MSSKEIIGLIYFGNGSGLGLRAQMSLQMTLAIWHFFLLFWSGTVIVLSYHGKYTKLARLVFYIVFIHSFSKLISNILYCFCIYYDKLDLNIAFDVFELLSIITYYCMYNIVLFSWIEVVFRVKHLGFGEERIHMYRNIFCGFTSFFILVVFVISDTYIDKDTDLAIKVFGIGLVTISIFSFFLSIAFFVYWIKLHKMVSSIQHSNAINQGKSGFLWKVGAMSLIFIICLDIKMVHYIINIKDPFETTMWDLYALNYFPEVIAVTVAMFFFGSRMSPTTPDSSLTETERSNIERRERKHLLSVNSSSSSSS